MLIAGLLMLDAGSLGVRLEAGWLRVSSGKIVELGLGTTPGKPDLGGEGCVITPGFIDAHMHLPQFDSIGQDGMPLLQWLRGVIFPAEMRWSDAGFAGQMTTRVARQLLSVGTTGIAAYGTVHAAGTLAAIQALHTAGLNAIVGQVLMDQEAPAEMCRPAAQLLKEAAALADHVERLGAAGSRVRFSVNPRFAISCSPALLRGAGELMKAKSLFMQTHLAETLDECSVALRLHPGHADYTDIYAKAGLIGPRSLLAHGVWLNPREQSTIAGLGGIVAHCPTANTFLQSGVMPGADFRRSNLRIALGSDVAGGPEPSMVRVARAMIDAAKTHAGPAARRGLNADARIPTPAAAWRQITAGNAELLGFTNTGSLRVGADADVLVVRPALASTWATAADPLGTLMYSWDDRWLETTIVNGRIGWAD